MYLNIKKLMMGVEAVEPIRHISSYDTDLGKINQG